MPTHRKQQEKVLPKILVIVGPTAGGKSDLAVLLAKDLNGEIISADSRQVYRGLDIGSGKITKKEMQKIPHHLLDVSSPKRSFSVAQYKTQANRAIKGIISRGKVPIICGGTGFYIQAVVDGLMLPEVKADKALRKKLSKMSSGELCALIAKKDPFRAEHIDAKNKVRLIRALEIIMSLGKVPPLTKELLYEPLFLGLEVPQPKLRERIHIRLHKRMQQGMLKEVVRLHEEGVSYKRMEALGLEYRFLARFLQKKLTKKEMLNNLETAIVQYAKRQYTWFRRDKRVHWLAFTDTRVAITLAKNFLSS